MAQKSKSWSKSKPMQMGGLPNFMWLGVCFALGAVAMICLHGAFGDRDSSSKPAAQVQVSKGPWGELDYTTINLERPDESFPTAIPEPQPIQWYFENLSRAQVEELFEKSHLSAQQKTLLLEPQRWRHATNGWEILPPIEVVRNMSLSARKSIYSVLQQSEKNTYIQNPCRFEEIEFEPWLRESGLPPEKQQLFRDLSIHEGHWINFYDGLLLEWLSRDPEERKRGAKALSRYPTLVMRLRVTPESDLNALEQYWARGNRGTAMRPFLESLAKVPQGMSVSVSFFFPPFARMRLYSYPDVRHNQLAHRKNCFYTAMNFFNEAPDYNFLKTEFVVSKLDSDYTQVNTNYIFGDVMAFADNRHLVHMCVYIADDVVFTKNGTNWLAPWVLMKRSEMLKLYLRDQPSLKMAVYRKNNI